MQFNGAALVPCIMLEIGWADDGFHIQTSMIIFVYIMTKYLLPILHSC